MPGDVQAFLGRESACQHFAGEEAYDEDRARELAYAIHETCDDRAALFNQLLQRHADNCLVHTELMRPGGDPAYTFLTTGSPGEFETIGTRFLGPELGVASQFVGGLA